MSEAQVAAPANAESNVITNVGSNVTTNTSALPAKDKIKVNGKEIELDYAEIKRRAALAEGAHQKFEEASKLRKEAEELKSTFSQKNVDALVKAGWTKEEIEQQAMNFLTQLVEERSLTPEQKAQREKDLELQRLRDEREELKKKEKDRENKEKEAKLDIEAAKYQQDFLKEINQLNQKTWLDLERPEILAQVINQIVVSNKLGYDLSIESAIKRIEDGTKTDKVPKKEYLRQLLKLSKLNFDDADLDALLEKGIKGIRERSVEAIKKAEAPFVKSKSPQAQSTQSNENKPTRDSKYYRDLKYNRIKPF